MALDEVYRLYYGGKQSSGLHVSLLLMDVLLWCRHYEIGASELIEDAAGRAQFDLPSDWKFGELHSGSTPTSEHRVALFDDVLNNQPRYFVSPRWRAVKVLSEWLESLGNRDRLEEHASDAQVLCDLVLRGRFQKRLHKLKIS